ncbi:MAG: DinB family protein [Candidatus Rokubacteria bacterium]|nr:DinB family protein [Candidatus Rokubacteria bacterium]
MTDEQKRIRGYLQAQGAKLTPDDIIAKVEAAMDELHAAAAAVPAARFDERPEPDEWSGNEVMAHVVDAGRHFGEQIVAILDGRPHTAGARVGGERRGAEAWWAVLARDRAELFARVRRADPRASLEATIDHGFFGPLNWREVLLFTRLHDLDHAGQLQKIATALAARPA